MEVIIPSSHIFITKLIFSSYSVQQLFLTYCVWSRRLWLNLAAIEQAGQTPLNSQIHQNRFHVFFSNPTYRIWTMYSLRTPYLIR